MSVFSRFSPVASNFRKGFVNFKQSVSASQSIIHSLKFYKVCHGSPFALNDLDFVEMITDPSRRFKMGSQDQNRSLRIRKQEGLRRLHILGNPRSYSFRSDHILLCIVRWWCYSFTHSRRIRAIRGRIRKETNHKVNNKSEAYIFLYFNSRLNMNHYKVKWISLIFGSLPGEVSELCFVHVRYYGKEPVF